MGNRDIPLNDFQLEVLSWIRDGCPDEVYPDYRPRVVARALHNRALVEVSGHGELWTATLTEDGAYYLVHGIYPSELAALDETPGAEEVGEPRASAGAAKPPKAVREAKPARVGPTDAMIQALLASGDCRLEIEYSETDRYRQLIRTAERFKKIPDGMQLAVLSDWHTRTAQVVLEPLPEWRTRVLESVAVPATLRDLSDIVQAVQGRGDLGIRAADKKRALRILQALVAEARRREYVVAAVPAPRTDRWGHAQRTPENAGHIKIGVGQDEYRLSVYQLTKKVEHVPTKSELARSTEYGARVPKWDDVPSERLGVRIDTAGTSFWGDSWSDQSDRPLEAALPQVLQELELRHDAAVQQRLEQERQRLERQHQWEAARERAVQAFAEHHRAEVLMEQVSRWRDAVAIREYATELQGHANSELGGLAQEEALRWVRWVLDYADRVDPLQGQLAMPNIPKPTSSALEPFMEGLSLHGPR